MLLVKLKSLYIQRAWILVMEKQYSNQKCEEWKDGEICQNHYRHKFSFGHFFSSPVNLLKDLNLICRPKRNHDFTNHGYLHCAILKASYNFKIKKAHEARDNQFLFQNVQNEILRSLKCSKSAWNSPEQPVESTQKIAAKKTAPHSRCSCVVTNVGHYYVVIIEGL